MFTQEQTPSDTFIEGKVNEWNSLGFNNIGNKAVSDKMIDFFKSSLQEQREAIKNKIMELVAYSSFEMNGSEPRDRNCTVREAMLELFEDIKHLLK
jgi:hypothetical protein